MLRSIIKLTTVCALVGGAFAQAAPALADTINNSSGIRTLKNMPLDLEVTIPRDLRNKSMQNATVLLQNLPNSMLKLAGPSTSPPGSLTRNPGPVGAGILPAASYYVERSYQFSGSSRPCFTMVYDTIDLSPIKQHGFTINRVLMKELGPSVPVRERKGYDAGFGVQPHPSEAGSGPSYVYGIYPSRSLYWLSGSQYHCHSSYGVEVWVTGPAGVDPLTGRRYEKSKPVN